MRASKRIVLLLGLWLAVLAPRVHAGFHANGWIVDWLLFGPLSQSVGDSPGENGIRSDFLTDGVEYFESTILPEDQLEVVPDFLGAAASEGFHPILAGENAVWKVQNNDPAVDTIDFNAIYGAGAEVGFAVVYAVAYVENQTANPLDLLLQLGSDDSIQVKIDDCEAFILNQGRGFGAAEEVQNSVPVTLAPGGHRVLVKVFNGGGGYGFRLRFANPATGEGVSDITQPSIFSSTEAGDVGLTSIEPVGLGVSHTANPDRVIGLEKLASVQISAVKTFFDLSDVAVVTVTENLPADVSYVAGSAVPAPASTTASSLTWNVSVADLVASGITFDLQFARPGSGCVAGTFSVAGSASCGGVITGKACVVAVRRNAIFLGDIIGGGDGSGTKPPEIGGVRLDMDQFLATDEIGPENNDSNDLDAEPFQPIDNPNHPNFPDIDMSDAADMIDGTFLMTADTVQINTAGITFDFVPGDANPNSWNHILSNVTHDIDKGVGNIRAGGREPFATGVGVHASAGVTFDLTAIRAKYTAEKVQNLVALIGNDGCGAPDGGTIRLYVIYSTGDEVLTDSTFTFESNADEGVDFKAPIPPEAEFMTFAVGDFNDGIGCDHGVFAEARIFPELPVARLTANPTTGAAPLEVSFNATASTAPPGQSIASYAWDFGDGSTGTGASVSHTYTRRGTYVATLTITDSQDLTDTTTSAPITVNFGCGNPAPFTSTDIGAPALAGCATAPSGGCITVLGGGKDIVAKSDQFQLTHQTQAGDSSITAQISAAHFDSPTLGKAGLMYRSSADPDSACAAIIVTPTIAGLRLSFISRTEAAASLTTKGSTITLTAPNAYLKLERVGNTFTGSYSMDGVTFETVDGHSIDLVSPPAEMLVGMAVTSRDSVARGLLADVTFCEVEITGGNTGGPQFHRGDADDNGQLQLTDAVRILGFLFLGGAAPTCMDAGDADDNGQLQLTDAVRVLGFLFLGGPPPSAPGPPGAGPCGPDPTPEDALDCAAYTRC